MRRLAIDMNGHDGPRSRIDQLLKLIHMYRPRFGMNVCQYRRGARMNDRVDAGAKRKVRHDHLVSGAHAQCRERQVQCHCAVRHGKSMPAAEVIAERFFKDTNEPAL